MANTKEKSAAFLPPFKHFATQAIHVGQEPEQWNSRALVPPITLSTTFKQHAPGHHSGFEYSRCGNPTRDCLEKAVAVLDGAKYCLAYASGLAATLNIAHLLKAGDTVICSDDVYGAARQLIAGNWKTARMLTVSLRRRKTWDIAINEKLTQKLRTHRGIKKRDTFRTGWQRYIDYVKKESNRITLAEAYRNL